MAKLSTEQQAAFNELARPYLENDQVQRMKGYVQHGSISTYAHCLRVAKASYALAQRLHLKADYQDLVAGALLHDFYLYDWHDRSTSRPKHATRHPLYAAENAVERLDVNPHVHSMIQTHMWPLPPTRVPTSREAWVLCAADKWCALTETLTMRRNRNKAAAPTASDYVLVPEGKEPAEEASKQMDAPSKQERGCSEAIVSC